MEETGKAYHRQVDLTEHSTDLRTRRYTQTHTQKSTHPVFISITKAGELPRDHQPLFDANVPNYDVTIIRVLDGRMTKGRKEGGGEDRTHTLLHAGNNATLLAKQEVRSCDQTRSFILSILTLLLHHQTCSRITNTHSTQLTRSSHTHTVWKENKVK